MKFLFFAAFVALASAVSYQDVFYREFDLYKAQYQKSYENPSENIRRMQAFLQTKYEIAEHNLKYKNGEVSYEMELNEYADWLPEDIEMLKGFNKDLRDRAKAGENVVFPEYDGEVYDAPNVAAPDNIDWAAKGAVTPVENQGTCGSCYAFSAIGALESQLYIKTRGLQRLSKQQIVDCSSKYGNLGCNGGSSCRTYNYIRDNGGVNTEAVYPYEGRVGQCRFKPNNIGGKCTGYVKVGVSEEALKNAVATVGPISVAINTQDSLLKYKSGVYYDPKCRNDMSSLDHAVLLVGYGTDPTTKQDYWLVKNSWGTGWGEKGYVRMARNKNNMCGIAMYALYPKV